MSTAHDILREATLYTDKATYTVVHLPPAAITAAAGVLAEVSTPFSAIIVDKDEVSLILPEEAWDDLSHRLPEHRVVTGYRLITFDRVLDFGLVGFMALVSRVLAESGLSFLAFSAFERDHLLVRADQFDAAWSALRAAQTEQ